MTTRRSKPKGGKTVLAHKKATVQLARNGLLIEVGDVSAEDCGLAAMELLDVMRTLTGRYEELVVDAGSHHAGPLGEVSDDEYVDDPPQAPLARKRPIGFAE